MGGFSHEQPLVRRRQDKARQQGVSLLSCDHSHKKLIRKMARTRFDLMFLRTSRDIEHVKKHGRRVSTQFFNMLACRAEFPESRVGIVVGRRFGNAVRRNRIKRVFRELIRKIHPDLTPNISILIFPKREALLQPYAELAKAWTAVLIKHRLFNARSLC